MTKKEKKKEKKNKRVPLWCLCMHSTVVYGWGSECDPSRKQLNRRLLASQCGPKRSSCKISIKKLTVIFVLTFLPSDKTVRLRFFVWQSSIAKPTNCIERKIMMKKQRKQQQQPSNKQTIQKRMHSENELNNSTNQLPDKSHSIWLWLDAFRMWPDADYSLFHIGSLMSVKRK